MKIGQVAPLYEAVPPKLYGGTERVVSYLTEELVRQGHEVNLFASQDSETKANLISSCSKALRLKGVLDPLTYHIIQIQDVADHLDEMDIVHFHIDYLHFPFSKCIGIKNVTTLHGRLDLPDLSPVYSRFGDMPVISISNSQRKPLSMANWIGTVYHGLPENLYHFDEGNGGYVAFLGRISPEKRVDRAIEIAKKAGVKIKIAAKVDKADRDYFETQIRHLLEQPHVEYIGEIGEDEKQEFLGKAIALLFPIDWPEPFGMVMLEAMACGTPVIAWNHGSVPEVLDEGLSGYIVSSMPEAIRALENIDRLRRKDCRKVFDEKFTATRMAHDYIEIYQKLLDKKKTKGQLSKMRMGKRQSETQLIKNEKSGSSNED